MKKGTIEWRVLEIICDEFLLDFDEIKKELKKRDLNIADDFGTDHMDILNLVITLEKEFHIDITDKEFGMELWNTKPQAKRVCRRFSEIVRFIEHKTEELQKLKV